MNASLKNKQSGLWVGLLLLLLAGCLSPESNGTGNDADSLHQEAHAGHHHPAEEYTCPMHPQIVQSQPGSCPICGMDLVKKASPGLGDSLSANEEMKALLQPTNTLVVANIATVRPERKQRPITLQAQGVVSYDTRRLYSLPARFGGRIERLYVRYNFQPIRKGQKLLELYSPDIITAQRELLFLLKADAQNAPLIDSARQKLRLLGLTDEQIRDLIRRQTPSYSLAVYSPYDGYVVEETVTPAPVSASPPVSNPGSPAGMESMGSGAAPTGSAPASPMVPASSPLLLREGQYVQAGQTLFRVVNPSRLWAEFRLYAADASGIKPGTPLSITVDQVSGQPRPARVDFIVPFFEENGQFVTVRSYLPATAGLRVGQLVRAKISRTSPPALWVPTSAVLDLGNEQIVFVRQAGPGKNDQGAASQAASFRPVRVQLGARAEGMVAIRLGLTAEQDIAQNAQFMIDSESFVNLSDLPTP
ncbi:efflux RND transporter periplasmic adaptor subunit [Larkinella insperata]|uniref:Efflux RND transporter periplasmic adaptor subunit n=1 Tax=Larkinella insperata TaxID=332158 RepID=A0ABW3Q5X6_9BACT